MNNKENVPWIEKFRPKKLDDILGQELIITYLKNSVKDYKLQNLLLFGGAGTGKTSSILAFCNEIYGNSSDCVLLLNASDNRDINIVKTKIVDFCNLQINNNNKYKFKIIILDEVDSMTYNAQNSLRGIMKKYDKYIRFCFICNYENKIIDGIKSYCCLFRFKPLFYKSIILKIKKICFDENIKIKNNCLNRLIDISNGDMRKVLNVLQCCSLITKDITIRTLDLISGLTPKKIIDKIYIKIHNKEIDPITFANYIINMGYPIKDILYKLNIKIINDVNLNNEQIYKNTELISEIDYNLSIKSDEYLSLVYLKANIVGKLLKKVCNQNLGGYLGDPC
jgi:replication factor C subunit 2/4